MSEPIMGLVGLELHAQSMAIGVAAAGRAAPHFLGTVGSTLAELRKAPGPLVEPQALLIVYEAGPCS